MAGRGRGGLSTAALAAGSVLLALLVAEGLARLWLRSWADDDAFRRYASVPQLEARLARAGQSLSPFAPHRYLGFVGTPGYRRGANRHDSLGLRGEEAAHPKPAGEFRIVCLGGSTTYGTGVEDWRHAYPARLEAELRRRRGPGVRVLNAGVAGWSSLETLLNFELRVLDLEPDLVLVYHGLNDLAARMVWPPSAYRGDHSGSVGPSPGLGQPTPLLERSTLARILLVRLGRAESHLGLFRNFARRPPTARYMPFLSQREKGIYPKGPFREASVMEMLERNPPVYFRRNLENLVHVARAHGVEPVLSTFVHFAGADDPALANPEVVRGLAEHNAVVRELGERLEVPVFPLAERFPQEADLFVGAVHFTPRGNQVRARLLADFLLERGLVGGAR